MSSLSKKAHRWSQIIGRLPGVAAVFLSGSVAQGLGTKDSDIDFLIIARPGCIWTARFFTNSLLKLTFNLSKPAHHKARICPNHFITADALEIVEKDAYSAHLFSHNQALYDPYNLWPQFVEANAWVHEFGEAFPVLIKSDERQVSLNLDTIKTGWLEKILRWLQKQKIHRNADFKRPGAKIVLRDRELRFHPDPKNQYWKSKKAVDLGKKDRQASVEIHTSA